MGKRDTKWNNESTFRYEYMDAESAGCHESLLARVCPPLLVRAHVLPVSYCSCVVILHYTVNIHQK